MIISAQDTLGVSELASMMDLGAVQANSTRMDVQKHADFAIRYNCKAVFALSAFLPYLVEYRAANNGKFLVGGTVGFPSGGMSGPMKEWEAREVRRLGADEVDMVINIGYLLSDMYQEAKDEIRAVKEAIGDIPLKVIIECHYLNEAQMAKACEIAIDANAQWIKTGTGWAPTGATLENVALIKKFVGDAVKIKAAGGVKNLETIRKMVVLGVERFGLGASAETIMNELATTTK